MIAELTEQGMPPESIASPTSGALRDATQPRNAANARNDGAESSAIISMDETLAALKSMVRQLESELRELYSRKCAGRIILVLVDHFVAATLADLDDVLIQARRNGQLTRQQFNDVGFADIIAQGTPLDGDAGDAPILAVIETALSLSQQDVRNAHRRAGMIQRLTGRTTAAFCVACHRWSDDVADLAAKLGVALIHHNLPGFDY